MSAHVHQWHDAPDWEWGAEYGPDARTMECTSCRSLRVVKYARCIFPGCVATWEHSHGGFPGGYDNPLDRGGTPIAFVGPDPDPGAVRDYHGAAL